jgi:hypothetical protein
MVYKERRVKGDDSDDDDDDTEILHVHSQNVLQAHQKEIRQVFLHVIVFNSKRKNENLMILDANFLQLEREETEVSAKAVANSDSLCFKV